MEQISPNIERTLVGAAMRPATWIGDVTCPVSRHVRTRLTPRQTIILFELIQGKPNKVIARDLHISGETVKKHVSAVLRVLGVSNRTQAAFVVAVGQQHEDVLAELRRLANGT